LSGRRLDRPVSRKQQQVTHRQAAGDQTDGIGQREALGGPEPVDEHEPASRPAAGQRDTRQRILDVALELFINQGYDGTSLRQIAERLGVTKAALYYHFASKEDLLLALHMRLHEFGKEALDRMDKGPVTLELWAEVLDEVLDQIVAQRRIFLLHERNQAAIEKLHSQAHDAEHEDLQNHLRSILGDSSLPLANRVRMAASVGVLFSGLLLSGEVFADTSNDELGKLLREVLHDILGARGGGSRPRGLIE
jgi:AcrR family transcriptional regulator